MTGRNLFLFFFPFSILRTRGRDAVGRQTVANQDFLRFSFPVFSFLCLGILKKKKTTLIRKTVGEMEGLKEILQPMLTLCLSFLVSFLLFSINRMQRKRRKGVKECGQEEHLTGGQFILFFFSALPNMMKRKENMRNKGFFFLSLSLAWV